MYCPKCRVEYREGFTRCADCQVALVAELPAENPDSEPGLVSVFESSDTFVIGMAKGSLEEAGIPFWMESEETSAHLALGPIRFPSCTFLVPLDREDEARAILDPLTSAKEES